MSQFDLNIGAIVLVGDHNWRKGPTLPALAAFLFGKRQRFTHLDKKCTVAWWRDRPYLTRIQEAR